MWSWDIAYKGRLTGLCVELIELPDLEQAILCGYKLQRQGGHTKGYTDTAAVGSHSSLFCFT